MLAVMMAIWRVCPHFIEVTALLNSRQIGPFEQTSLPLPLPPSLPSSEHHHHLDHQHDGHVHVIKVIVRMVTIIITITGFKY